MLPAQATPGPSLIGGLAFQDRFCRIEVRKRVPIDRHFGSGRGPVEKIWVQEVVSATRQNSSVFGLGTLHASFSISCNIHNPSVDSDISEADITEVVITSDACRPE